MKSTFVHRLSLLICLSLSLFACNQQASPFRSTAVEGVTWGKDFELTAQTGERQRSIELHGKLQILFFGYTHCPDICAPTLARLAQLKKALGAEAPQIQVLFISVDPQHDSPAQLKKFLAGFDPTFLGLTGTEQEVRAVAADHKVYFKPAEAGRVAHTGMLFVKDRAGHVRLLMKETAPMEDMLHDLRLLLAEK